MTLWVNDVGGKSLRVVVFGTGGRHVRGRVRSLTHFASAPKRKAAELSCDGRSTTTHRCVGRRVGGLNLIMQRSTIKGVCKEVRNTLGGTPTIVVNSRFSDIPGKNSFSNPTNVIAKLRMITLFESCNFRPRCPLRIVTVVRRRNSHFKNNILNSHVVTNRVALMSLGRVGSGANLSTTRTVRGVNFGTTRVNSTRHAKGSMGTFLRLRVRRNPLLRTTTRSINVMRVVINVARVHVAIGKGSNRTKAAPVRNHTSTLTKTMSVLGRLPKVMLSRPSEPILAIKGLGILPGKTGIVPGRIAFAISVHSTRDSAVRHVLRGVRRLITSIGVPNVSFDARRLLCTRPIRVSTSVRALLVRGYRGLNLHCQGVIDNTNRSTVVFTSFARANLVFIPDGSNVDRAPRR